MPGGVARPFSDHCIDGWDMDSEDMTTVVLFPDYVIYRGSCYTDSLISFTGSYIEMEGSEVDRDEKGFKCKWRIEDILHITSHWYEQVSTSYWALNITVCSAYLYAFDLLLFKVWNRNRGLSSDII